MWYSEYSDYKKAPCRQDLFMKAKKVTTTKTNFNQRSYGATVKRMVDKEFQNYSFRANPYIILWESSSAQHLMVISGQYFYRCKRCSYIAGEKGELTKHLNTHQRGTSSQSHGI